MRRCEVLGLRLADVHPGEKRVFIAEGKGGHQRIGPISARFFTTLASYLDSERPSERPSDADTDRVFVVLKGRRRGLPLTAAGLDEIVAGARHRARSANWHPSRGRLPVTLVIWQSRGGVKTTTAGSSMACEDNRRSPITAGHRADNVYRAFLVGGPHDGSLLRSAGTGGTGRPSRVRAKAYKSTAVINLGKNFLGWSLLSLSRIPDGVVRGRLASLYAPGDGVRMLGHLEDTRICRSGGLMTVAFRVLGPVEAEIDGHAVDLGHARQRCVLAALLVDANRLVPVETLLARVWAEQPPQRARAVLSGYLSRLRSLLAPATAVTLIRRPGGYLLAVDPMTVDMHRFRCLVRQARAAGTGAAALFDQAFALWHGEPFATLDTPWLTDVRGSLGAERLAAELDRNDLALDRGEHAAVLAELSERAAAHPFDERLAGQLILALYRSGRQGDALRHYERLRLLLADELGVDPGPSLQQLHRQILTADPEVAGRPAVTTLPRQLPAAPESFTGRTGELDRLDAILAASEESPTTMSVCVVSGTAGVGKTALALHWAHRVADRFRDGQLYVNLRGFDPGGSVLGPGEALRGLLGTLDVPPHGIPTGLEAQAALYRSLLAGRRALLVLDNARDVGQLRPLLPGTPGCQVVVTSRDQLTGLIAGHGAQSVVLDLLTTAEAGELLAGRVGQRRAAAEPEAVDEIVTRCARLPLALAVAAARAATRPRLSLAEVADELRDSHSALDALADIDPTVDVRAVLSWSYRSLSLGAARLFRLLGAHPGPDISVAAAASLAGLAAVAARALLGELAAAHLVTEHVLGRYLMHDLLRAYAAELAHSHHDGTERRHAVRRMLDHYLHTAHAAARLLDPHRGHAIILGPAADGVSSEQPDDYGGAVAWFDAERAVVLAAVELAARDGHEAYTCALVWTLAEYLHRQGHWYDWVSAGRTALDAAQRVADRPGQAISHRGLGNAYTMLGRYDDAGEHYQRALDLYAPDDHIGHAHTRHNLTVICVKQQRIGDALGHAEEALRLFQIAEHRHGQVKSLNAVGFCHTLLGDHDKAVMCCRQALSLYVDLGDRLGEASAWHSLGYAHHQLGRHDEAADCYRHALDLFRDLGSRYHESETLADLGDTYAATEDFDRARTVWRQATAILKELDHPEAERVRAKLEAALDPLATRESIASRA